MKAMKIFRYKKAQGGAETPSVEIIPLIFYFVFLAIVGSTTLFFVDTFMKTKTDVMTTYGALLPNQIMTADYGITKIDVQTQRNYITTVDLSRFEDSILDSAIYLPDNRRFSAKLTIKKLGGEVVKEAYLNKAEFVDTKNNLLEQRRVTILDRGNEYPGIMDINIRVT
jgi:hypothetical protein